MVASNRTLATSQAVNMRTQKTTTPASARPTGCGNGTNHLSADRRVGSTPATRLTATPWGYLSQMDNQLPGKRYAMSPDARANMAAAQKTRWAKVRMVATKKVLSTTAESGAKKAASAKLPAKAKARPTMSAEARAKIAAAQKARWAKIRAEKKAAK